MATASSQLRETRSLDEWYRNLNGIYYERNLERDSYAIFAHLVEVIGGLSLVSTPRRKPGVTISNFGPKALAWWLALAGKVRIRSVEEMVWAKFPGLCPYCQLSPHQPEACRRSRDERRDPDWQGLQERARDAWSERPRSLADWMLMFEGIYPTFDDDRADVAFARLTEELGELAEAVRAFPVAPGYFLSEAADVFAWLVRLENLILRDEGLEAIQERASRLANDFAEAYPDKCKYCGNFPCRCPSLRTETLGRIGHETQPDSKRYFSSGPLLSTEETMQLFDRTSTMIRLGDSEYPATDSLVREIHQVVVELKREVEKTAVSTQEQGYQLTTVLQDIDALIKSHEVTAEMLEQLAQVIADMPAESRGIVVSFLTNMAAGVWVADLLELIRRLAT